MINFLGKLITKIYHKVLNLFFEFDTHIYAEKTTKIPTNTITNLKYNKEVIINSPKGQKIKNNIYNLTPENIKTNNSPSLLSALLIRNLNSELYQSIKLREENLKYLCISKDYNISFTNVLNFKNEQCYFLSQNHKSLENEICISRYLRTIEEILELEPYTHNLAVSKLLKIPVIKYPVKKESFTKNQLDLLRTKLAAEAKCKKYSITIDNIFDKIPAGLYSKIELAKDNTINCKFSKQPQIGELQLLVTGKRRYDTQTTKTLVKYSEINF